MQNQPIVKYSGAENSSRLCRRTLTQPGCRRISRKTSISSNNSAIFLNCELSTETHSRTGLAVDELSGIAVGFGDDTGGEATVFFPGLFRRAGDLMVGLGRATDLTRFLTLGYTVEDDCLVFREADRVVGAITNVGTEILYSRKVGE